MKIIYPTDITPSFQPCVATVGIFDGVHAGHRFLLDELKTLAHARQLESTVLTFAEHPRKVLSPDFKPQLLTTLSEKIALLELTGVDNCIVINFTQEMAKLSAYDFIKSVLSNTFNVQTLLVGHDHRFGHKRTDGIAEYKQYGNSFGMEVIEAQRFITSTDVNISSSNIRTALLSGNIELANRLLTYPYSITGNVVAGFKNGRKIGFPTANILPSHPDKIIPQNGVYHVNVCSNNRHYNGMLNIGNRPTLNNGENTSIEVHILDFDEDIYNQEIEVSFLHKIRDERKFNGLVELTEQLQKDKNWVIEMNK